MKKALSIIALATAGSLTANAALAAAPLSDAQFAAAMAKANQQEIAEARSILATTKDPEVRAFANRMIADHSTAQVSLQSAARTAGIRIPPGSYVDVAQANAGTNMASDNGNGMNSNAGMNPNNTGTAGATNENAHGGPNDSTGGQPNGQENNATQNAQSGQGSSANGTVGSSGPVASSYGAATGQSSSSARNSQVIPSRSGNTVGPGASGGSNSATTLSQNTTNRIPNEPAISGVAVSEGSRAGAPAPADEAYMRAQVDDHRKVLAMIRAEETSGKDAAIRSYASAQEQTVAHHLALARGFLKGALPPSMNAPASPAP